MSEFSENKKVLPFGLKDTKAGSQLNPHKITAFEVAPTRKTAFEKSREEAQRKAEREAAETAAALQDFEAEYGAEEDTKSRDSSNQNEAPRPSRETSHGRDVKKRQRFEPEQRRKRGNDDDESGMDSETEERERRRIKLKSGSHFLDELKQTNRRTGRPVYQDRNYQANSHAPAPRSDSNVRPPLARQDSAKSVQETKAAVNEAEDESGDDVDYYRTKISSMHVDEPLNRIHQAKLKFLLDTTTARRGSIARVTAFAMTHASSIDEISTKICDSVAEPGNDWKICVARLWCISDILHNSWIPIPNVWKYRNAFEERLEAVLKSMRQLGDSIESRIRCENYRRLVEGVLQVWSTWICFSNGFVDKLYDAFDDTPEETEEVVEAPKEAKKSRGWKTIGTTTTEDPSATGDATHNNEPEAEPSAAVELDGEAIDLDGEAVDLDGQEIDLDDIPQGRQITQGSETVKTYISEPIQTSRGSPPMSATATTTATVPTNTSVSAAPKIKMSFGKFSIPKRDVATKKPEPESHSPRDDLDEYEQLAGETSANQPDQAEVSLTQEANKNGTDSSPTHLLPQGIYA
ncbi:protein of unknown function [Taphrina deformans PYCC 5710]|uniref:CID domain-containing protein n=1 Tax=Taphrina deformans (strain PYCC 5710 / ATCC 11124 / CBS 356.35 / IMI 108563 / JCM 9778 / NBRC 8474) TaxID=1097556 RepID=R4XFK4_TAPDE|nr:protein of unknown function [Taphrina deformans PYCC 5710]|eukprot:CCG84458.1 protein of unknown function [Taphrina deformans PYCC 5710]